MGLEIKPSTKPDVASSNGNDDDVAESPKTVTDVARQEWVAGGSERVEATNGSGAADKNEWRKELTLGMAGLRELTALDGKTDAESTARRAELVQSVDTNFQKAFPHIRENATAADVALFGNGTEFERLQKDKQEIITALGLPKDGLTGDALKNRMLNATTDTELNQLTQLQTINEMTDMAAGKAGQAIEASHLPYRVGLEYSRFLSEYKGGVTSDINNRQNVYSALDVLHSVNSAEMQANGGDSAIKRTSDQQAANANAVIPEKDNPLVAMQQALQMTSPADAIPKMKEAAALADKLNPEDCRKQAEALKAELAKPENANNPAKTQELQQKIAAWDSLSHSQGLTNVVLGRLMLQNQPPDFTGARDALLKASKDTVGANAMLDERGQPMYSMLMMLALTEGKNDDVVKAIQTAGTNMEKAGALAKQAMEAEGDEGRQKNLLNQALQKGNESLQAAKLMREAFGGKDAEALKAQITELKKKPEGERSEADKQTLTFLEQLSQFGEFEASVKVQMAGWDLAKGDGHAAQRLLNDVEQNHPEYMSNKDDAFKAQFSDMKQGAASAAEDQDIDGMSNWNPLKHIQRGMKWAGDHWKYIAFGAACVIAAAVTIGTAGAGVGLGAALVIGAGAGLVGGTVIGGGLQAYSGKAGFVEGMGKALPYAAAGAAVGSVGAYYFAPAALAGGTGLGAATGSGFLGTALAGAKVGAAGGAFWNAGEVKQKWDAGKYDSFSEAATDWGAGTAGWAMNGALAGSAFGWGGQGLAALRGASELSKGAIALNSLKGFAGITAVGTMPSIGDGLGNVNKGVITMATGEVPRWMVQDMYGFSRREYDAWKAMQESGGGAERQQQPVEAQPQPVRQQPVEQVQPVQPTRVERTGDPKPANKYDLGNYINE